MLWSDLEIQHNYTDLEIIKSDIPCVRSVIVGTKHGYNIPICYVVYYSKIKPNRSQQAK